MFAAVAAHKFVIAFCIGVELTAARTRRYLSIIYVCTFAIVSPLGIGIGMILVGGESAPASGPLAVILQVVRIYNRIAMKTFASYLLGQKFIRNFLFIIKVDHRNKSLLFSFLFLETIFRPVVGITVS